MTNPPKPMPFNLPEYEQAQAKFLYKAVHELMEAKDELFRSIPKAAAVESIPTSQNTMPSGEVVLTPPVLVGAELLFNYEDIQAFKVDAFLEQVDKAADESLRVVMTNFFKVLKNLTDATGNSVDAGGKPVSHDLILDMYETMEMPFDRDGHPEMPTIVMHPKMAEQMRALPAPTPAQEQRFKNIIERKRNEHNARQRDRKLR
ncbi:MAG: hypothetical protein JWN45_3251 [Acidobacteriaceae bacterium]|nr:hypothetical protein [Acidobacteriaceae bacterium]